MRLTRLVLTPDKSVYSSDPQLDHWIRSPDGSLLAIAPWSGHIVTIWDMKTVEERFRLNARCSHPELQFSESGNILAVDDLPDFHFWDTKTGQKGEILKFDQYRSRSHHTTGYLRISEKGEKFLLNENFVLHKKMISNLCVWEVDGLRKISHFQIPNCFSSSGEIALSPNGELFCLWSERFEFIEVGSFSSTPTQLIHLRGNPRWVGFMPDGKDILIFGKLIGDRRHGIYIWDVAQESLREFFVDLPLDPNCRIFDKNFGYGPRYTKPFISPDGKLLALVRRQPNRLEIFLLKIFDPKSLLTLIDLPEIPGPQRFSGLDSDLCGFIQFASAGTHIITERGNVLLPGVSLPSPMLFAARSWIQEDGEDILAIPPEYQGSLFGIHGHTITFHDKINGPLFVRLDEGAKTMTV